MVALCVCQGHSVQDQRRFMFMLHVICGGRTERRKCLTYVITCCWFPKLKLKHAVTCTESERNLPHQNHSLQTLPCPEKVDYKCVTKF